MSWGRYPLPSLRAKVDATHEARCECGADICLVANHSHVEQGKSRRLVCVCNKCACKITKPSYGDGEAVFT